MAGFDFTGAYLPDLNTPPALAVDPDELARQRLAAGLPAAPPPMIKAAVPDPSAPGGFRIELVPGMADANPQPPFMTEAGLASQRNAHDVAAANAPQTNLSDAEKARAASYERALAYQAPATSAPQPQPTPPAPPPLAQATGPTPPPSPAPAPGPKQPQSLAPTSNEDQFAAGQDKQKQALEAQGQTEVDKARAEALGQLQAVQSYQAKQQADMEFRAQVEQNIAAKRQDLEQQVTDLGNQKIDPSRVFKNASTPALIGGAIVAFLSGFQSLKTGKNPALDMINKVINDDVAAQAANLENQRASLGAKQTLLQEDIAAGHDAMDARLKASALAYDTAIKAVSAEAARIGSPEALQKAQQLIGQLDQQKAQTFEEWQQKRTETAIAQQNANTSSGHLDLARQSLEEQKTEFRANFMAQQEAALRAGDAAQAKAQQDPKQTIWLASTPERDADGKPTGRFVATAVQAPGDPEAVKKVNESMAEMVPVMQLIDANIRDAQQYRTMDKLGDRATPWKSEIGQRIAARQAILASLAHGLYGRVNEQELKMVVDSSGDASSITGRETQMKAFREALRSAVQGQLGGVGVRQHWEPPSGEPELTALPGSQRTAAPAPPSDQDLRDAFSRRMLNGDTTIPQSDQVNYLLNHQYPAGY